MHPTRTGQHTTETTIRSKWYHHIRNCVSHGEPRDALVTHIQIRRTGIYILGLVPLLLKACASLSLFSHGRALHADIIKAGMEFDVTVGTSLVAMYAKCGDVCDAWKMFDIMPERNVVTWNAMIGGYMKNGDVKAAALLFEQMPSRTAVSWIEMIDGYSKRGNTKISRQYFSRTPVELKNIVTWTAMVDGYSRNGEMEAAREVFEAMPGRNFFVWSSMISGYFRNGDFKEAEAIFDRIPVRNLVNWNSLISGYTQNGLCEKALDAFRRMQVEGFEPDEVTLASVLSASAQLGSLDVGKELHQMIIDKGIKHNNFILNGLVDMYAKCGDLENARLIFDGIPHKNDASWNAIISGFATHGQCGEAIEFFNRMENSKEMPDDITFLVVLSACAHAGFVKEALEIFSKMEKYGLKASTKHYGCLVDILGRAGKLEEAYNLIEGMPVKTNDAVWGALLGSCRVHSDMDMANRILADIGRQIRETGLEDDLHYVLLANIYAAADKWEDAEKMRMIMLNKGFQKTPGCSSVMLNIIKTSSGGMIKFPDRFPNIVHP